jgi:hypothetical protein
MTPIRKASVLATARAPAAITPKTGIPISCLNVGKATADAVLHATTNIFSRLETRNCAQFLA